MMQQFEKKLLCLSPGERCNSFDHVDNLLLLKTLQYDHKHNMSPYIEESKIAKQKQRPLWDPSIFPECVARVPVSLWGSGGWGCVRSTLRLRRQPLATVRNRPQYCYMAVPMVSSAERSFLEVSNIALLRFAWQPWHFVTFRRHL